MLQCLPISALVPNMDLRTHCRERGYMNIHLKALKWELSFYLSMLSEELMDILMGWTYQLTVI